MIITAKFRGEDGSRGYRNGKTYVLRVSDRMGMSVERIDGSGQSPYQSLSAFLHNRTEVKTDIENGHENPI